MKDLHNHVLYGIDDGSSSYEQSLTILNNLYEEGVTDIVVTPHYIVGTDYNSNNKSKLELLNKIKSKTKINLYLGNEVYLDNGIIECIKKGEISTINNSNYLLVEFPLNEKLECASKILFELREVGIIPIIAHPERYHYFKIDDLIDLVDEGCLLQGNITSLSGKYGKRAKQNLELLLKKQMIHVLGTDTHRSGTINLSNCLNQLRKLVEPEIYDDLTSNNFDKIIQNEKVSRYAIKNTNRFFKREKIR